MAENVQKNSRKSRLEPRECTDFAVEKYSLLQEKNVSPLPSSNIQENGDKMASEPTSSLQFDIEVTVEQCDEDMVQITTDPEEHNENPEANTLTTSKCDIGNEIGQKLGKCKMDETTFRKTFEELSKTTTSVADKLLEIEIKNVFGKFPTTPQFDRHKALIQEAIANWRIWHAQSKLREGIISYKCYICKLAWWHLTDFRDHIKTHDSLKVDIEISLSECHLICFDKCSKRQDIEIKENCWKCLKSHEIHMTENRHSEIYFFCEACRTTFLSCAKLLRHEGICQRYHKIFFSDIVRHENDWKCNVCTIKCITKERYDSHMHLSHSVRSDVAVPTHQIRRCEYCYGIFFTVNTHTCPKKHSYVDCKYCCRKFQTRWFANLHETMSKNGVYCKICDTYLKKQCMEMEHMLSHSDNYVLSYKCLLCADYTLYSDEYTIKRHRSLKHKNLSNSEKKRPFSEMMLVPKLCMMRSNEKGSGNTSKPSRKRNKSKSNEPPVKRNKAVSDALAAIIYNENYDKTEAIKDEPNTKEENTEIAKKSLLNTEIDIKQENETTEEDIESLNIKTEVEEPCNVFQVSKNLNKNSFKATSVLNDKELEYEKTLSKVFQSTKSFTTTEPYVLDVDLFIKEEPIDDDEYEDDIIVLNTNFIHDHEDVNLGEPSNFDQEETNEINDPNDFGETCNLNSNNDNEIKIKVVQIKTEETSNLNSNNEIEINVDEIKIEPGTDKGNEISDTNDFEENDNSKLNINNTTNDMEHDKINIKPTKRYIVDIKSEPYDTIDMEMSNLEPEINIYDGYKQKKTYKCNRCDYVGYHKDYRHHIDFCKNNNTDFSRRNRKESNNDQLWGLYHCTKCDQQFKTLRLYVLHFRNHNLPFGWCPHCNSTITPTSKLVLHLATNIRQCYVTVRSITNSSDNDNVFYKCTSCTEVLKYEEFFVHWEKHLNLNVVEKEIKIEADSEDELVGDTALSVEEIHALLDSLQQDTKKKNSRLSQDMKECVICGKSFERHNDCKRHLIEHLLVDAFANRPKSGGLMCQICLTIFVTSNAYKKHMRDHAHLPVYNCELCDKSFSDSSNFTKHKKVHNLKVLLCDICNKKFASKIQLIKHIKLHEKFAPVKCEACNLKFFEKSLLRRHMRHHTGFKSKFRCPVCRRMFLSLKDKWDHMWTLHGERNTEADCSKCHMSFRKFQDLKRHMRVTHHTRISKSANDLVSKLRQVKPNKPIDILSILRQLEPKDACDIATSHRIALLPELKPDKITNFSIMRQFQPNDGGKFASTLRQSNDSDISTPRQLSNAGNDFSTLRQLSNDGSVISSPRQLSNVSSDVSTPRQLSKVSSDVSTLRQLSNDGSDNNISSPRQLSNAGSNISTPRQFNSNDGSSSSVQRKDTFTIE